MPIIIGINSINVCIIFFHSSFFFTGSNLLLMKIRTSQTGSSLKASTMTKQVRFFFLIYLIHSKISIFAAVSLHPNLLISPLGASSILPNKKYFFGL